MTFFKPHRLLFLDRFSSLCAFVPPGSLLRKQHLCPGIDRFYLNVYKMHLNALKQKSADNVDSFLECIKEVKALQCL